MERRRFLRTESLYQLDNFAEHSLLLKIQAVRIILDFRLEFRNCSGRKIRRYKKTGASNMEILFVINIKMIFVFVHEYVCLKSVKQL